MRHGFVVVATWLLGATVVWSQSPTTADAPTSFPRLVTSVNGRYTPEAKAAKIEGWVSVSAEVRANGTVGEVQVAETCLGHFGVTAGPGHIPFRCTRPQQPRVSADAPSELIEGLQTEALKAAQQWVFTPGTKGGRPVPITIVIKIEFDLERSPKQSAKAA